MCKKTEFGTKVKSLIRFDSVRSVPISEKNSRVSLVIYGNEIETRRKKPEHLLISVFSSNKLVMIPTLEENI
jgi:hypothetical protein